MFIAAKVPAKTAQQKRLASLARKKPARERALAKPLPCVVYRQPHEIAKALAVRTTQE